MEFLLFEDKEMSIMLPSYLKAKSLMRDFVADRRRIKQPEIHSVAIDMPYAEERASDIMNVLSRTPTADSTWDDVQDKVIRKGEIYHNGKGYEVLSESHNMAKNTSLCRLDRVLCMNEKSKIYAYFVFLKSGPIDGFYDLCIEIISSAKLIV